MSHRPVRTRDRVAQTLQTSAAALVVAAPAHAAGGGGLQLVPDLAILIGMLIGFSLLVIPLNALLFQPLFRVLDERSEKIAGARRRAEKLEEQANEILGRYEAQVRTVREQAEDARRSQLDAARAEQARIANEARAEAAAVATRSRAELERARADAAIALRAQTEELADDIASQVLGRAL